MCQSRGTSKLSHTRYTDHPLFQRQILVVLCVTHLHANQGCLPRQRAYANRHAQPLLYSTRLDPEFWLQRVEDAVVWQRNVAEQRALPSSEPLRLSSECNSASLFELQTATVSVCNCVTLQVREMGQPQTFTVQCVLLINALMEKAFIVLWAYYNVLTFVTLFNFTHWSFSHSSTRGPAITSLSTTSRCTAAASSLNESTKGLSGAFDAVKAV